MSAQDVTNLLLGAAVGVQAVLLTVLFAMHEKLRRRVTMVEDASALHGQISGYGVTPQQTPRAPGRRQ